MTQRTAWCDVCRGDAEKHDDLIKCAGCPKRFHLECAQLKKVPGKKWVCQTCEAEGSNVDSGLKARVRRIRTLHAALKSRAALFYRSAEASLAPFVPAEQLLQLTQPAGSVDSSVLQIGPAEQYIKGTLRPYQVDGVNWMLSQYSVGIGGILGDEV